MKANQLMMELFLLLLSPCLFAQPETGSEWTRKEWPAVGHLEMKSKAGVFADGSKVLQLTRIYVCSDGVSPDPCGRVAGPDCPDITDYPSKLNLTVFAPGSFDVIRHSRLPGKEMVHPGAYGWRDDEGMEYIGHGILDWTTLEEGASVDVAVWFANVCRHDLWETYENTLLRVEGLTEENTSSGEQCFLFLSAVDECCQLPTTICFQTTVWHEAK